MKRIIASSGLFILLSACGAKKDAASPETVNPRALSTQSEFTADDLRHEPLVEYTGFWIHKGGARENIVRISSEESSATKSLETKIYGLDLFSDFGYRALAFADKDNPRMDLHENRVEALMEKTLSGKKSLIQIDFILNNPNLMTLTISAMGKTLVQSYERMEDEVTALRRFRQVQIARIEEFYAAERDNVVHPRCADKKPYFSDWASVTVACFKTMFEVQKPDPNAEGLLHIAAKRRNLSLVKYLLSHGASVQQRNREGRTALQELFKSGLGSFILPDHGAVPFTLNVDAVIGELLNSGAQVDSEILSQILLAVDDVGILNQAIDGVTDFSQMSHRVLVDFMSSYATRGAEKHEVLKKLLSRFSSNQMDDFSHERIMKLWAIKYLDSVGLEILVRAGFKFYNSSDSPETTAQVERQFLEKALNNGRLKSFMEKKGLRQEIATIDQNLAWIQARR